MSADHVRESARAFAALVQAIPVTAWDGPGLGAWDLRALAGHTARALLTIELYLDKPADAVDCPDAGEYYALVAGADHDSDAVLERGRQAGRDLGADPAAGVDAIVARVLPLLDRDDDPLVTTIFGGMRLSAYLPTRTVELVVHSLDIATAAGLPDPAFSTGLYAEVLGVFAGAAAHRGSGSVVLRGLTGRASLPADFSLI